MDDTPGARSNERATRWDGTGLDATSGDCEDDLVRDDGERFSVAFDPESDSLVETVVTSVAAIRGEDPVELPPLGESIDAEGLERITGLSASPSFEGGSFEFAYCDLVVTVDLAGELKFRRQ